MMVKRKNLALSETVLCALLVLTTTLFATTRKLDEPVRYIGVDKTSNSRPWRINASVMMDLHIPEVQKKTLTLIRQTHQTEGQNLDQATESLDENETPQRHEVAHLIRHFVHHGYLPHNLESKG